MGLPDDRMGEIPKAYIVLRSGETASEEDIMNSVRERLATYKQLRAVTFMSALPKGATGKILRRELRDGASA